MEQQKELATSVPGVSVAALVRSIQEGVEKPFDPKHTRYLRSFASSLKHEFPDRIYSVNEIDGETKVSWKTKELK